MWLVVGLGNPGSQYEGTRHNVGFDIVDAWANRHGFGVERGEHKALTRRGRARGHDVIVAKPQTFMNLSGDSVGALARYYKVEPTQLVVVHDELDFAPGEVRLKLGGGHGGHNGLRSIAATMGPDFVRVRVGIGKPPPRMDGADFVLSRARGDEKIALEQASIVSGEALDAVLDEGVAAAMNRVNRRA